MHDDDKLTPPPALFSPALSSPALYLLDSGEELRAFSEPTPQGSQESLGSQEWVSSIVVEGMHCTACALNVEDAIKGLAAVRSVQINAASRRGQVVWQEGVTKPSIWLQAIVDAGYNALPAFDKKTRDQRLGETRLALWRWLVAGFCMMQVMMYAMPEYVALPGEMTDDARHLMRWASWLITLPVVLFSCKPFFVNAWQDIRQRRVSMDLPVALGMAITFVVSSLGTFDSGGIFGQEVYFDSLTMFVFFLLTGRWWELRLRDRTAGALEALINKMPDSVERQRQPSFANPAPETALDGDFERILLRQLRPLDLVRVAVGSPFPADGTLVAGTTHVDEALLTGESKPIYKQTGDAVIAGSHNLDSVVIMRVEKMGSDTRFSQIVGLMAQASLEKPQLAQLADRFAKPFLIGVLLLASLAAVLGWQQGPGQALMVAVAVLIVTCPCALSLATPAAMLASAGALAKRGILVRRLQALETLSKVDTFIFDKTGTLTEDGLMLAKVHTRIGLSDERACQLAALMGAQSLHPVSRAMNSFVAQHSTPHPDWRVRHQTELAGSGITAEITAEKTNTNTDAGANDSPTFQWGSASFCGVSPLQTTAVQAHLADADGWLASFEFQERVRDDAAPTLEALQREGIGVQLLSGDSQAATQHLADALLIANYRGLCTPDTKLALLQSLQRQGHVVAMVGDGLNDGPALAAADVSFAFGKAVPLAQSKSDFIVLGDRLSHIAAALLQARRTLRIVKQNLAWALIYNLVAIPLALAGWLPAWLAGIGMATSSVLVVGNAMRLTAMQPIRIP